MRTRNSCFFNAAIFVSKLALFLMSVFLLACSRQNNPPQTPPSINQIQISASAININTASAEELERLPHIGRQTAQGIIEHREKFGRFRRPEHLLFVDGISDADFRRLRNFVKVE